MLSEKQIKYLSHYFTREFEEKFDYKNEKIIHLAYTEAYDNNNQVIPIEVILDIDKQMIITYINNQVFEEYKIADLDSELRYLEFDILVSDAIYEIEKDRE